MNEIDVLKEQIAKNEIYGVLESLNIICIRDNVNLKNELILLKTQVNRNQQNSIKGIITNTEYNIEQNRIASSVLSFIEILENYRETNNVISQSILEPIKSELPKRTGLEKIISGNTLQNITWLEKGLILSKSICRITLPKNGKIYYGTGFIINQYLFTNHHVLNSELDCENSFAEFNYETDLVGKIKITTTCKLNPKDYFFSDKELDITIVKLNENNLNLPHLLISKRKPDIGEFISIIQHPSGGPKKIVTHGSQITNLYDYRIQYNSDTMRGSSGSPVFDKDWNIIAIHHAGGDLEINETGIKKFTNQGILMNSILEKIDAELLIQLELK